MSVQKQIYQSPGFPRNFLIVVVALLVVAGVVGIFYWQSKSKLTPKPPSPVSPGPIKIPAELAAAKRLIKPKDIVLEKVDVGPKIPKYNLPLKTKDITNYQKFSQKIQLSPKALSLLEKNGFVVVPTPKDIEKSPDEFAAFYSTLKNKDIPIFITTDSLLHYYHIFFDTTLMKMERDLFYDDVWQMSKGFLDDALSEYESSSGGLKEAARRNVAYLSVALELLKPKGNQVTSDETLREEYCKGVRGSYCEMMIEEVKKEYGQKASLKYFSEKEVKKYSFEVPSFVKPEVQKEIELIEKHQGWEYSPIFIYKEDYSQYVPRGHYTKSEKLKNYFKAMMWYGRMTALIKGSPILSRGKSMCTGPMNGIISEYDAKIQTLQASLIAKKFLESKNIQEKWQRMYAITSFFVGFSDDLGPYEYSAVLKSFFKEGITPKKIEGKYSGLRDALLNLPYNPKIYSGLGSCQLFMPCPPLSDKDIQGLKVQAKNLLKETKGFRLIGQRFTIDSWLFSEIVSPYSGEYTGNRTPRPFTCVKTDVKGCPKGREVRGFPRGLDIMALFGSKRAKEILRESGDTEYSDYEKKFSELKKEIDSLSTNDWFKNLYWNWLYVLKSLLNPFGLGYQTFMQTNAWQDKELNTALASWSELRHDTILYVKQSYTMAEMGGILEPKIVGYVEPVPEFYARLLTLTEMTNKGLKELVPQEELEKLRIDSSLNRFSEILKKLLEISKKELENKPLKDQEYYFIRDFGSISESLIEAVSGGTVDPEMFKTVLVADVHTDGNTRQVLEEGVGYIKTLIVAYKLPQGHILIGLGPVFSHYEFKQPMKNRLTDEAWRKILESKPPAESEWVRSFSEQ